MLSPPLLWFLVGLGLVLLEFPLPGVIAVFFGLGSWVAALTAWAGWTPTLALQLWVFALSSLLMLAVLRRWFRERFFGHVSGEESPQDDLDLQDLIGHEVEVVEAVDRSHVGRVEFKGAGWSARSAGDVSLRPGQRATIVGFEGITLLVDVPDSSERSTPS